MHNPRRAYKALLGSMLFRVIKTATVQLYCSVVSLKDRDIAQARRGKDRDMRTCQ